jgi:general secretion pathway protein L
MSAMLFYDPESGNAAYWQDAVPVQHGLLAELRAPLDAVTVLLGGSVLAQIDMPVRQRHKIIQAVPYALEESLCEDIEMFHFAVGERDTKGQVAVSFMRDKTLRRVLEELRQGGWQIARLIPDVLAVPRSEHGWGIIALGQRVLVRTGAQQGFAVEEQYLAEWLPLALADYGKPARVDVYSPLPETCLALLSEVEIQRHEHPIWLAHDGFDLRQGEYTPRHLSTDWWRPWRLSAALAVAWLLLHGVMQVYEVHTLTQARQHLQAQMTARYREVFPEARHIINPRLQMTQYLASLQHETPHEDDFWRTVQIFAEASLPKSALQRLDYRQGSFELLLELPDLQSLENFKQALVKQGLNVEIRAAESRQNKVEARLRVMR